MKSMTTSPPKSRRRSCRGNFGCGLHVHFEDHLLDGPIPVGPPGIDIDGHQRFRRVDQQVAPGFEGNPFLEDLLDLVLEIVLETDGSILPIVLDDALKAGIDDSQKVLHSLVDFPVIDQNALDVGIEVIPE